MTLAGDLLAAIGEQKREDMYDFTHTHLALYGVLWVNINIE